MNCKDRIDYSLYLVADMNHVLGRNLTDCITEALEGGATLLQLRDKNLQEHELLALAREVKSASDYFGVPLIINDNPGLAKKIGAAGVHLGPDDMSVSEARRMLGENMVIGASANCLEEALSLEKEGADYLGVGALFPTETKKNAESVNLDTLREIKNAVEIPVVGIGGICHGNARRVIETGVDGIAVVSAILKESDIKKATSDFSNLIR